MVNEPFRIETGIFGETLLFKRVSAFDERLGALVELAFFPFWSAFILLLDGTLADIRDFFVGRVLTVKKGVYHDGYQEHPRYIEVR